MKIAITGGRSALGRALAQALGGEHEVRVAPEGDLRDEAFAKQIVEGANALIHLAALYPDLPPNASEREVLDLATRGTYALVGASVTAGAQRIVLGSTLALFERYPATWRAEESWQPLPDVRDVGQLAAYLAEESVKQFARVEPIIAIGLRFGEIVDDAATRGKRYDPRWVHLEDAVQAVQKALAYAPTHRTAWPGPGERPHQGWWVFHIAGSGEHTRFRLSAARGEQALAYAPAHDFSAIEGAGQPRPPASDAEAAGDLSLIGAREHIPPRPIRNVVIFGAGGPLAAATARVLAPSYRLRLTDLRAIAEIAAGEPQSPGAPLPQDFGPPHETRQVDVANLDQVMAACEGMDAIINCSVVRPHPVNAFLVNFLGAYNVMRAAVAHDIHRVVHTGPQIVSDNRPSGYWWDFDVPDDVPPRPAHGLYGHTKYLGLETVRLFAEQYDLTVPALHYSSFVNPEVPRNGRGSPHPMTVSWDDAGHAMRRALEALTLPRPFEIFHILADLPHGKYSNAKAKRLLAWQPRDNLAHLWARR